MPQFFLCCAGKNRFRDNLGKSLHRDRDLVITVAEKATNIHNGKNQMPILGYDEIIEIPDLFLRIVIDIRALEFRDLLSKPDELSLGSGRSQVLARLGICSEGRGSERQAAN